MDKLIKKLTSFAVLGATVYAVSVPAFAADPFPLDFANKQLTGVSYGQAYSFDKEKWTPVFGVKLDLTKAIEDGSTEIYILKDLKSLYNLTEGATLKEDTGTGGDYTAITIPAKAAVPTTGTGAVKFTPSADGTEADTVSTKATHEYKIGNLAWAASADTGVLVGNVETYGGVLQVRTKAVGTTVASDPIDIEIEKLAEAPGAKYDEAFDAITEVDDTMEYCLGATLEAAKAATSATEGETRKWAAVADDATKIYRAGLGDTAKRFAFVRVKGSADKAASAIRTIALPAKNTKTVAPKMDIAKEKITSVSNLMEYRALNDAQSNATDGTATYSDPEWTAISGTEINLADIISPSTAQGEAVVAIEVRLKPVAAVTKPVPALPVPASAPTKFTVAKRPATPVAADDFAVTYADEKLKLGKETDVVYEFKTSTGTSWVKYTGSATKLSIGSDGTVSALKIPAAGKDAVSLSLRRAATTTGTTTITYVPASEALDSLEIVARPDAPAPEFDKDTNKLSGVDTSMQFTASIAGAAASDWDDLTTGSDPLKVLNTVTAYAGNSVTFNFRLKATTTAPASAAKSITCTVGAAPATR